MMRQQAGQGSSIDLYWLPLGAGGRSVRLNGKAFEAIQARIARRPVLDLYHSALEVRVPEGRFIIEMTPVPPGGGLAGGRTRRGVVAEGAVGVRRAERFRVFRYEVHCSRDGVIPDVDEAVASPRRLSDDAGQARCLLDLVPSVPTPVWGRDELGLGEMWNSNSLTSWLLARTGLLTDAIEPPAGGRAPGWHSGIAAARREQAQAGRDPAARSERGREDDARACAVAVRADLERSTDVLRALAHARDAEVRLAAADARSIVFDDDRDQAVRAGD